MFLLLLYKKICRGGLIEIPVRKLRLLYTKHVTAIILFHTRLYVQKFCKVRPTREIIRTCNICAKHSSVCKYLTKYNKKYFIVFQCILLSISTDHLTFQLGSITNFIYNQSTFQVSPTNSVEFVFNNSG